MISSAGCRNFDPRRTLLNFGHQRDQRFGMTSKLNRRCIGEIFPLSRNHFLENLGEERSQRAKDEKRSRKENGKAAEPFILKRQLQSDHGQ